MIWWYSANLKKVTDNKTAFTKFLQWFYFSYFKKSDMWWQYVWMWICLYWVKDQSVYSETKKKLREQTYISICACFIHFLNEFEKIHNNSQFWWKFARIQRHSQTFPPWKNKQTNIIWIIILLDVSHQRFFFVTMNISIFFILEL